MFLLFHHDSLPYLFFSPKISTVPQVVSPSSTVDSGGGAVPTGRWPLSPRQYLRTWLEGSGL